MTTDVTKAPAQSPPSTDQYGLAMAKLMQCFCQPNQSSPAPRMDNPFRIWCDTPPITVEDFCVRLEKYYRCSPACFVVACAYLSRIQNAEPALFHPLTAHKLILGALTVATKFCEDVVCSQSHYAKCGGIEQSELNGIEFATLTKLDFRGSVSDAEYRVTDTLLRGEESADGAPKKKRISRQSY